VRMIVQGQARDKSGIRDKYRVRHIGRILLLLSTLLLLTGGCGGNDDNRDEFPQVRPLPCPIVVNASGWRDFDDLVTRIAGGRDVTRDDLVDLAESPSFAVWSASFPSGGAPNQTRITNWLAKAFADEIGIEHKHKMNSEQRDFSRSYLWSRDRRDLINQRLHELDDGLWCELDKRLRRWVPADDLPDTVRIEVLPSRPELRYYENHIFIDSGVIAAGNNSQLLGQLTALAYRNLAVPVGPGPLASSGTAAIASLFKSLAYEGVASWLEDIPNTIFAPEHPVLGSVQLVPEDFWDTSIRSLASLDRHLPAVLEDPDGDTEAVAEIVEGAVSAGLINRGGWCMASTIVAVLGEERLLEVAHSVPEFVAAYQEATRNNAKPLPPRHEVPGAYQRAMPPFSPGTWDGLLPLLEEYFSRTGDLDQ